MLTYPIPTDNELRNCLQDLIGRDVALATTDEMPDADTSVIGVYRNSAGAVGALCICDPALACRAGAALSMIPPPVANESAAVGRVPDNLLDNFGEVLNVFSVLLNRPWSPHLRLSEVLKPRQARPEPVRVAMSSAYDHLSVRISISGYGDGLLSVRCTERGHGHEDPVAGCQGEIEVGR